MGDLREAHRHELGPEAHHVRERTSSGKGPGSVSGGASYVLVGPSDTLFFTGKGTLRDIQVQLRLTGMSLSIPPGLRAATVQYTIIDVP